MIDLNSYKTAIYKYGAACVVGLLVGSSLTYFITEGNKEVVEKFETIEKFQTIEKTRIVRVVEEKTNKTKKTKTVTETRPDGTKIKTKDEVEEVNTSKKDSSQTDTKVAEEGSSKKSETKIVTKTPDWHLSFSVGTNSQVSLTPESPFVKPLVFGIQAERRISGPLFLGIYGKTDKSAGIVLGGEF